MFVSIIIPVYKKEKTIQEALRVIYDVMEKTRWDFEIIAVVDGFLDDSYNQIRELGLKNLHVVGYEHNRGKGYAVRYGMARAKGDYIAFIDDSMEIDPNGISMILEHMEWYNADIIVASKRHKASKTNFPLIRKIYSWGYYLGVRFLFGLKVTDTQTGLKVFRREVLEKALPRLLVKEYAFDIELLAVAHRLGFRRIFDAPVEVDIDFSDSGGSRFKKSKPLFFDSFIRKILWDTLAVFYRVKLVRYYDDSSKRKWVYDKELDMNINTGEIEDNPLSTAFIPDEYLDKNVVTGPQKDPKFSVVIVCRAMNDWLRENIKHLKKLKYSNFEVVIVLDKEKDFNFKDKRFKLIVSGPVGPGEKKNIGAKHASGDILAFLDDDSYPSENWLNEAAKIFKDSNIYALGAPAITPPDVGLLEKCSGLIFETKLASWSYVYRYIQKSKRKIEDYVTVNLFVRKDAFNAAGGFTTEFWPGEDTKLCLDLVKHFERPFEYNPKPVVYHHRRNIYRAHLKQVSRYGRHRGQFARIFPETSRLPSYFIPTLFVIGLFSGPIFYLIDSSLWYVYLGIIYLYMFLIVFESVKAAMKERSLVVTPLVGFGIFLTHIVYGTNFLIGFLKRPELRLKAIDRETGSYTEG